MCKIVQCTSVKLHVVVAMNLQQRAQYIRDEKTVNQAVDSFHLCATFKNWLCRKFLFFCLLYSPVISMYPSVHKMDKQAQNTTNAERNCILMQSLIARINCIVNVG